MNRMSDCHRAAINPAWLWALLSAAVAVLLLALLRQHPRSAATARPEGGILVFCAESIRPPVEAAAKAYEKELGIPVQLECGETGAQLTNLLINRSGDIFVAADQESIRMARGRGLIAETIPLAHQHPAPGTRKGNPKGAPSPDDMDQEGIADGPQAASPATETVTAAILQSSRQPSAALRFARYLAAKDRGLRHFAAAGYSPAEGDAWAKTPEIVFFSGAVNRVAVEDAIRAFEEREGCRVIRVYNGCGILVAQMKAGGRPDAYLTCDETFLPPVADLFEGDFVRMSETDIVIVTRKGNPKNIRSLRDLARPGLRIGVTNPEQSTLGALTQRMLENAGIKDNVMANVVTMTPTADMLLNETRTGALDASVVYIANANKAQEHVDICPLDLPGSVAVQTFSAAKNTKYRQLVGRLLAALRTAEQNDRYKAAGFRPRHEN